MFLFMDLISNILFAHPMVDKSTKSCIEAFEALITFILRTFPAGTILRFLFLDSATSWARNTPNSSLHGTRNVAELDSWLRLPDRAHINVKHSLPHTQALNPVESIMGQVVYKMNFFLHRGNLDMKWLEGMMSAAIAIINCHKRLYSRDKNRRRRSPFEIVYGFKFDFSQWVQAPGGGVHALIEGSKASQGHFKSDQAIFVRPAGALWNTESGWVIRYLSTLKLGVTRHMSVVDDLDTRMAMLEKSDSVRIGGMVLGKAKVIAD